MRYATGAAAVTLAITVTACGGSSKGSGASTTGAFVAATHAAWSTASGTPSSTPADEKKAAAAWSAFAFTVEHQDAGDDKTQQGQLVALAQQAAAAYSADYAAFQCQTSNAFNSGDQSPQACPPSPGAPDDVVAQMRDLVQGL